ncbi:MAG: hypothetical protein EP329_11520 [Deltaproteobacteria bacterium]|nr:MAG: hypothetical protein EP329_11520 [Deltaproteobacteria bacterium]
MSETTPRRPGAAWWRRTLRAAALVLALGVVLSAHGEAFAGDAVLARQLTDRGIELQNNGEHGRAVALFDAALAEIDHPKIRYFRAKSLRALGRFDEALKEFTLIRDEPQVAKYRDEIVVFMNDIQSDKERAELEAKLEAERKRREELERERKALEDQAEQTAIERMKNRPRGLLPPIAQRPEPGAPNERIVPLVPAFVAPSGEYTGALEVAKYTEALDDYETNLTLAKTFTVVAVVGVSVGVGLGANPAGDGSASDGARQAGLAVGVVGLMSGLVAAVLWPDEPKDLRPAAPAPETLGPPEDATAATERARLGN